VIVILAERGGPDPTDGPFQQRVFIVEDVLGRGLFALAERAGREEALVTLLHF